jgi:predicted Fe-Mo cluster-binding NifX family protein
METIRIAVVSSDGVHVDDHSDHFGMAERFLIYDMAQDLIPVADRPAEKLSVGDPNHPFDGDKFKRVVDTIKDCSRVYVACIGRGPAGKLKEMGIEAVVFAGPIENIPD